MGRALGGAKNVCAHKKSWIEQYGQGMILEQNVNDCARAKKPLKDIF